MNCGTMFETNPNTRTSAFDRPSTLRTPLASTFEFGKSGWGKDRSIWNSNNSNTEHKVEEQSSRPHVVRQGFASSIRFGKASSGAPLSPIDNPRNSTKTSNAGWALSNAPTLDTRHRPQLTFPTKQTQSSWLFNDRLDLGLENSSLLVGSAPEVEYNEDHNPQESIPSTYKFSVPLERREHEPSYFDHDNTRSSSFSKFRRFPMNGPQHDIKTTLPAVSGPFSAYPSLSQDLVSPLSTNPSPTARGFGRGSAFRNGAATMSPTPSRFSKHAHRDLFINGDRTRPSTSGDNLTNSFTAMGFDQNPPEINSEQPASDYPYELLHMANGALIASHSEQSQSQMRHLSGPLSGGATSSAELGRSHTPSGQYPSIWHQTDPETNSPLAGDYKFSLNSPYYSATGTPPTGPDSIRSAGGSGISSRTSHHDISLVDRKLRNLELYQPYSHAQGNGFLPIPGQAYDYSMQASAMRMNPLAAPYHVSSNNSYACAFPSSLRMPAREPDQIQVIRSPLLEEFRMSIKTNKRYELRDIFHHVVEFSGDQHGSRFIQQKLETANSDEKDQIFKEIHPNSLQLMTDVFGNYVIQKMFEHGNQSQKKALANHMKGHVLNLSTQMYGCRVVQKALEHVLTDQQASMVKELDGPNKQVLKVIRDQNGNHVVQKAIERLPAEHIHFIIEAHKGEVVKLATHTYGCRVIQRILEHCEPAAKRVILDEIHGCVGPLITDSFGNYVIQHVIQNGEPDDRRRVVSIVQQQLFIFSKHKFASNVVEKCIEFADDDQRGEIVRKLIGHNEQGQTPVLGLLRDQYGNYVIQKIHSYLRGAELEALTNEMKLCFPQLKRTSYGKQVMAIEKLLYGISGPSIAISNSSQGSAVAMPQARDDAGERSNIVGLQSTRQVPTQAAPALGGMP